MSVNFLQNSIYQAQSFFIAGLRSISNLLSTVPTRLGFTTGPTHQTHLESQITTHTYTTWTPAEYTLSEPKKTEITTHAYEVFTPAKFEVGLVDALNVLPTSLMALVLAFSGNSVSSMKLNKSMKLDKKKIWDEIGHASIYETLDSYMHSPILSPIVSQIMAQKGFSPHTLTPSQCMIIDDLTRKTVLNRARHVNISVEDPSTVHLRTLLERVTEKEKEQEDRSLISVFGRLRDTIPTAPTFAELSKEEKAHAIRLWMGDNQHLLNTVTQLTLSFLQLERLPPEIGLFTSLELLNVTHNRLRTLPAEIGQLANLETLGLTVNQLQDLPPEIGQLVSLETLNLSHNQLQRLPKEIGQLTHLTTLLVSGNQLQTLPTQIEHLTSLTMLDLDQNQLQQLPTQIGQLARLNVLSLRNNPLLTIPPAITSRVSPEFNILQ